MAPLETFGWILPTALGGWAQGNERLLLRLQTEEIGGFWFLVVFVFSLALFFCFSFVYRSFKSLVVEDLNGKNFVHLVTLDQTLIRMAR